MDKLMIPTSPLPGDANATSFDSNSDSESIVPLNELHLTEFQVNRAPLRAQRVASSVFHSFAARKTSTAANPLDGAALSKAARAAARAREVLVGVGTGGD